MAFQRIRIKNTNVAGKIPVAGQLDVAELCINLKDKKLFSKDADGNIIEVSGASGGSGTTPPQDGNKPGDLFYNESDKQLYFWNGTDWEKIISDDGQPGGGIALGELSDVDTSGEKAGDVLAYDGSEWKPADAPPADISGSSIKQLNDVCTGMTPTDGQILHWVNADNEWCATDAPDLSDYATSAALDKEIEDREKGDDDLQQQLDALGNVFTYMGTVDATTAAPPTEVTGHVYLNTGTGTAQSGWTGLTTVSDGDLLAYGTAQWGIIGDSSTPGPSTDDLDDVVQRGGTTTGDITANSFTGDGSGLTNLQWDELVGAPLHISASEPSSANHGDLWVDTSSCPPVLKVYADASSCPDDSGWNEIEGGGGLKPIEPKPGDGNDSVDPPVSGDGTSGTPYILTPKTVQYGGTATTTETIKLVNQTPQAQVRFEDQNTAANGTRFAQAVGVVELDGTYETQLTFDDDPDSTEVKIYSALFKLGEIYYTWAITMEPAPALKVGKGVITPTADVETGDTLTGSATLVDAENPVIKHVWEQDSVIQGNNTATYTAKKGSVRYRQEVTDDNNQSAVIGDWSDAVTVTDPPGPSATMSGLRFNAARKNDLTGSQGSDIFTVSFWFKKEAADRARFLINASDTTYIHSSSSGNIGLGDNGIIVESSTVPTSNVWNHAVISHEPDSAKVYINGVLSSEASGRSSLRWTGDTLKVGSNGTAFSDTYMSDFYYVDGKIAPPTAFGKFFPGDKWGPLDSAVVQDNLESLQPADPTPDPGPGTDGQPYDRRADTSKEWSANFTTDYGASTKTGGELFDGSLSTNFSLPGAGGNNTYGEYTNIGKTGITKLELYAATGASGGDGKLYINDTDYTSLLATGSPKWIEIPETELQKVRLEKGDGGFDGNLYAFRADGRLLVDQGVWNVDQNWSDYLSGTLDNTPANSFDGNTSVTCQGAVDSVMTLDLSSLTASTLEIYCVPTPAGGSSITIAGSNITNKTIAGSDLASYQPITISNVSNPIGVITLTPNSGNRPFIGAIKADGALLVDAGAQWNSDKKWSDGVAFNPSSLRPATQAFDGKVTGPSDNASTPNATPASITANFSPALENITSLKVWGGTGGAVAYLNGNSGNSVPVNNVQSGTVTSTDISSLLASVSNKVSSITIATSGGANAVLSGVEANGKLLVDGTATWDTGEVWVNELRPSGGNAYIENPEYAFDGDTSRVAQLKGSSNGDKMIFGATLTGVTKLELLSRSECDISGTGLSPQTGAEAGWVTLYEGAAKSISNITLTKTGNDPGIYAIRRNGKILVSGGRTWNTDQTWSGGLVPRATGDTEFTTSTYLAFDGNFNTAASAKQVATASDNSITFTPTTPIAVTSDIKVTFAMNSNYRGYHFQINSETPVELTVYNKNTFTLPFTGNLTSLKIYSTQSIGSGQAFGDLYAIQVDDKVLVDPGFGNSGFYLPFDPAQTGANYSGGAISGAIPSDSQYQWQSAFDGNLSTRTNGGIGATYTLTLPSPITITDTTKIDFHLLLDNTTVEVNGGSIDVSSIQSGGTVSITGADVSGNQITSFGCPNTSSIAGISIDGVLLVDHSSVGVDAKSTGAKNNFHDQNFGVDGNSSQVWSKEATNDNGTAYKLFDGSLETAATVVAGTNASNSIKFTSTITASDKVEVFVEGNARGEGTRQLKNNGSVVATLNATTTKGWQTFPSSNVTFDEITSSRSGEDGGGNCALKVDGVMLLNPSAVDTVSDTPMKSFAILDGGRNGGLNLTANQNVVKLATMKIPSTGKYYFEYYMIDTTSMAVGVRDAGVTSPPSPNTEISITADGTRNDGDGTQTVGYLSALQPGDVVGVLVDVDGDTIEFTLNGVAGGTPVALSNLSSDTQPFGYVNSNSNFNVNFGQQPYVQTKPAGYEGLYQEWSEYARNALGYSLDRIAALEARSAIDAVTIEDLRTQVAGALSRIASIESDEVNDDAVDNSLITLVGNLSSQITTWSERIQEVEAVIAEISARIDTLES